MSHHIILAVSLTLTIFLTSVPSSSANSQFIIDTCKKIAQVEPLLTGNYQLCVDFLKLDPRSEKATLEGLGRISFELTKNKTVAIRLQIKSLLADPKVEPEHKKLLKDCAKMYGSAIDSISEALNAVKKGDLMGANIFTSAAMNAPDDCEDGFESSGICPIKQENNEIGKFYSINLVFTNLMKK